MVTPASPPDEIFSASELWSQVDADRYSSCYVPVTVGSSRLSKPRLRLVNEKANKSLFIENASVSFVQDKTKTEEEPPRPRVATDPARP
jgi:hypothetical protein